MDEAIFPQSFEAKIGSCKYGLWVERLDRDSFEALLCAIAEFSTRVHRECGRDHFPFLIPADHTAREPRMKDALETLATIQASGRVDLDDEPAWAVAEEWSRGTPFFPLWYREHLLCDSGTAWAHNLDERSLAEILFRVAEYSVRCSSPPEFDLEPETAIAVGIALATIVRICGGERITPAELRLRIAGRHQVIDDKDFWLRLEYETTRWLASSDDRTLRRFWIDGFLPDTITDTKYGVDVEGKAWVVEGQRSDRQYCFVVSVPQEMLYRRRRAFAVGRLLLDEAHQTLQIEVVSAEGH